MQRQLGQAAGEERDDHDGTEKADGDGRPPEADRPLEGAVSLASESVGPEALDETPHAAPADAGLLEAQPAEPGEGGENGDDERGRREPDHHRGQHERARTPPAAAKGDAHGGAEGGG